MPRFGRRSKRNLSEAHPLLQDLFNEVIKHYDCAVIEGHRGKDEQDRAFHSGASKLKYPQSKHNKIPAYAVDVIPWPVDWHDKDRFYHFCGFVKATAIYMGINIRMGCDWDGDHSFTDQSFHDYPHFELIGEG